MSLTRGCVANVWVHQNLFVEVIDKKGKQKSVGAIAESKAKEAADGGAGAGAGAGAGVDGDDVRSSSSLPCERLWWRRTHTRTNTPHLHSTTPWILVLTTSSRMASLQSHAMIQHLTQRNVDCTWRTPHICSVAVSVSPSHTQCHLLQQVPTPARHWAFGMEQGCQVPGKNRP